MRAIVVAFVLLLAPVGSAIADNDVGCGVGTEIMEGKEGLGPKLAASFINGLLFQSISITFGLINCNGQDTVTADARDARLHHYAGANIDRLMDDMAVGRGESLDAFAILVGISESDRPHFLAFTQRHFRELYSRDDVTAGEVLDTLDRLMVEDARLSAYARG